MRLAGISSARRKAYKKTTHSNHSHPIAPNLLQRNFSFDRPDQAWVGDITYIPTGEGWLYLAIVKDLCTRKIVGYAFSDKIDTRLTLAALQTMDNPALHLAVHLSMILSLREGEILGLQPENLNFDAADGWGTVTVSRTMQRASKEALAKIDPAQIYHTFPDRREGSKSSLILKQVKTKKSNRVLYMTRPLKEELLAWLDKMKQDEQAAPDKYSNCGQLFRLPDGLPIAPELLTKWYRQWRAAHPEFEKIVFHGLRHSSATYQLLQSGGDFKSVQGNTSHATAGMLMDTYAHTQDKPRLELAEKIEANFYKEAPIRENRPQNETPEAAKVTGQMILEAIRQMSAEERRELTRALFA